MLRPVATRWLEVLCPRGASIRVLAELARTGAVEVDLDIRGTGATPTASSSTR